VVLTTVKLEFMLLWVVALCSVVVRYQYFGEPYCLHLQDEIRGDRKVDIGRV
jgi:hypothetical protein